MNRAQIRWMIAKESLTLIEEAQNIKAPLFLKNLKKKDRTRLEIIKF